MTDYDFRALNDKEFEVLCTDLLSQRDSATYERFKPGRDGGVDGRFFTPGGGEVILQCKHWATSPLERLVKHLRDSELPKIVALAPSRYVLAISHALSRTDKANIQAALAPFVTSPSDILGRESLNDLLATHPEIERRHYKLWIGSTSVLQYLLNKPVHDRSAFAQEEIVAAAHLYVPTANHDTAIAKLEQLGSVIITGPAGIGKSTLADHLALHYIARGYKLVSVFDEIGEAESVFDHNSEQVFYFDDFLGRNYLEALTGHEGAHIVQFIRRVKRDRKKRFILTSRTTVLNQSKALNDIFQNNNVERNEFEVTLESFSALDRARVLYNHIWHSDLSPDYIDALYEEKRYREIVQHRNYNPRLIRFITDSERLANCTPSQYWPYAKALLDNPARVWENPFESQLDDFGRALVLLVALNGKPISQSELSEAYSRLLARPECAGFRGRNDFLVNIKHLAGSVLSRTIQGDSNPKLDLFNPSVGDFIFHRYSNDLPALRNGYASLRSATSVRTLADLTQNDLIAKDAARNLLLYLLQGAAQLDFTGYTSEYVAKCCVELRRLSPSAQPAEEPFASSIDFIIKSDCPFWFVDAAEIVDWARDCGNLSAESAVTFVSEACTRSPTATELTRLSEIVSRIELAQRGNVAEELEEAAVEYLVRSVHDEIDDSDVFQELSAGNIEAAEKNLRKLATDRLTRFGIAVAEDALDRVVEAYDVNERHDDYFKEEEEPDDEDRSLVGVFHLDEIDDLFERTR